MTSPYASFIYTYSPPDFLIIVPNSEYDRAPEVYSSKLTVITRILYNDGMKLVAAIVIGKYFVY
jgi:hypothetical protein